MQTLTSVLHRRSTRQASTQARSGQEPYYIKVSSCDGLADAHRDHLMDANIPILFDEVRPGRPQGSRKPMDVENLKKITEVTSSTTLEARFRDIQLNYPQPRIFTFNGQICLFKVLGSVAAYPHPSRQM